MITLTEPAEAFIYRSCTDELRSDYPDIFKLQQPLKVPAPIILFDKSLSLFLLVFCIPFFIMLILINLIEGIIVPENSGNLFYYYNAISRDKIFKKWKFRIIKQKFLINDYNVDDWHRYQNEWKPEARTIVGKFVKKFYLDELPQLFCILKGEMSFIGPRPLAVHHYERDVAQGNIARKFVQAGLLGNSQIRKGTKEFGNPKYEMEYMDCYMKNRYKLIILNLKIIAMGIRVIIKGGGH